MAFERTATHLPATGD